MRRWFSSTLWGALLAALAESGGCPGTQSAGESALSTLGFDDQGDAEGMTWSWHMLVARGGKAS